MRLVGWLVAYFISVCSGAIVFVGYLCVLLFEPGCNDRVAFLMLRF
jgi:hypothetical protein